MKQYNGIVYSGLDDSIEIGTLEAEDIEGAYERADEMSGNFENWIIFNERQWNNLKKALRTENLK